MANFQTFVGFKSPQPSSPSPRSTDHEMEANREDNDGSPSIPPNYVSLAQLRDRWLQEQERKKREKQEEEREKRRRCGLQENLRKQKDDKESKNDGNASRTHRRPLPRNDRRTMHPKDRWSAGERHRKPPQEEEGEKETVAVAAAASLEIERSGGSEESKKKKKKSKKRGARNRMADGTGNCDSESDPAVAVVAGAEGGRRSEGPTAEGKILGDEAAVCRVVEVGRKFENLSMNYRGGGRGRSRSEMADNGVRRGYTGDGLLNRFEGRRTRGSGKVCWVKKGESGCDGNVAVGQPFGFD